MKLPAEVKVQIFSFLDPCDLFQLQRVNKQWKNLMHETQVVSAVGSQNFCVAGEISITQLSVLTKRLLNIRNNIRNNVNPSNEFRFEVQWILERTRKSVQISVLRSLFTPSRISLATMALMLFSEIDKAESILDPVTEHLSSDECKVFLNGTDYMGRTPLHSAVYHDNLPFVHWLLQHGADTETEETQYFQTPLLVAVQRSSLPIVQELIHHNASITSIDKDRMSILPLSRLNRNPQITTFCRELLAVQ